VRHKKNSKISPHFAEGICFAALCSPFLISFPQFKKLAGALSVQVFSPAPQIT
jgi:hypothetical protein